MAQKLTRKGAVPLPTEATVSQGWGKRIEVMLTRVILGSFNSARSTFGNMISNAFRDIIEDLEQEFLDTYGNELAALINNEDLPNELRDLFRKSTTGSSPIQLVALIPVVIALAAAAVPAIIGPLIELVRHKVSQKTREARVSPDIAIPLIYRNPEQAERIIVHLQEMGWEDDIIKAFFEVARPRIREIDLISAMRRDIISQSDMNAEMTRKGYTQPDIDTLLAVTKQIPNVSDLVRMSVREVFSKQQATDLGLFLEVPGTFTALMEKQGFDKETSDLYWAAHWDLPSLTQAFAMHHRLRGEDGGLEFSQSDLTGLIKALDISPPWRERLQAISTSLYTRVDLRRMRGLGVLTREQVKSGYRDLGYTPERAENLTEFAERLLSGSDRNLSRSVIQTSLERDIITSQEADEQLTNLGYNTFEKQVLLDNVEFKKQQDIVDIEVKIVARQYIEGDINSSDVFELLGRLNLPASRLDNLIRLWDTQRKEKAPPASTGELTKQYKQDIIDSGEFERLLSNKGFTPTRISRLIRSVDLDIEDDAIRIAERLTKEAERLTDRADTDVTKLEKSKLDVTIADLIVSIASIKVVLSIGEEDTDIDALKTEIARIKLAVAELRKEKRELTEQGLS